VKGEPQAARKGHFASDRGGNYGLVAALVATQAAEVAAVANDATRFVEVELAGGVVADEVGGMADRFEVGVFGVTLLATKGVIDIAMADNAIRHLRHGGSAGLLGFGEAAVASLARIAGVEVTADVPGGLKVGLLVDGGSNERRQITHFEVQGVIEGRDAVWWGRGDVAVLVAGGAGGFGGQEIVRCLGTSGSRRVAGGAL